MAGSMGGSTFIVQAPGLYSSVGTTDYDTAPTIQDIIGYTDIQVNPSHIFLGWNTAQDGSGDTYAVGDPIDNSLELTYYSQWGLPEEEQLLISNYSLIGIADAIREQGTLSVPFSSMSIETMKTTIPTLISAPSLTQSNYINSSSASISGKATTKLNTGIRANDKSPFLIILSCASSGSGVPSTTYYILKNGYDLTVNTIGSNQNLSFSTTNEIHNGISYVYLSVYNSTNSVRYFRATTSQSNPGNWFVCFKAG